MAQKHRSKQKAQQPESELSCISKSYPSKRIVDTPFFKNNPFMPRGCRTFYLARKPLA